MAVPNPRTWTAAFVDDADLNSEIRDTANFLLNPPHCYAYRAAAATITTGGTEQLIGLDSEQYDWSTTAMHDTATNNSRVVLPETGVYTVSWGAVFAANATGRRTVGIRQNAAGVGGAGTLVAVSNVGGSTGTFGTMSRGNSDWSFTAGDYVEMFCFQDSGSSLALAVGAVNLFLAVMWKSK